MKNLLKTILPGPPTRIGTAVGAAFTLLFVYWYFLPGFWEPFIDRTIQTAIDPCPDPVFDNRLAGYWFWKDLLLYLVLFSAWTIIYLFIPPREGFSKTLALIACIMISVGIGALILSGNIGDAIHHPAVVMGAFAVFITIRLIPPW